MPGVGAGFGDHVDDRTGVPAVLGAVGVGKDFELLNGVGRRAEYEAAIEGVIVGGTIELEIIRLVAHAVDIEAACRVAEAADCRVAVESPKSAGWGDDAWEERAELSEIATV